MHTTLGLQCKSHLSGFHVSCPPFSGEGSCYESLHGAFVWLALSEDCYQITWIASPQPTEASLRPHTPQPTECLKLGFERTFITTQLSQGYCDSSTFSLINNPHGSPERGHSACTRGMAPHLSIACPEQSTWTVRGCNLFWPSTL